MFKISIALISLAVFAGAVSCGGKAPAGPKEIAERMFEAAQARDYDKMYTFMSPEMQDEINEAVLARIEIISFTIDEIEYSDDSTEVEVEYTLTLKELGSGDTEVMEEDMDMIRTSEGEWVIVDM
ncbi:MAG: nuclear transport factor 2 family protein [Candidatus Aegiribacteria sp.]|nr:nuclear transport factor 2 family protein [Candidatus Aegiribacteria sp.]